MVSVLAYVFEQTLKLLHPFIPYVTEYIYERLNFVDKAESVMISEYADTSAFKSFKKEAAKTEELVELITALRKFKIDNGKKSSDKVNFACKENVFVKEHKAVIEKLANIVLEFAEANGKTLVLSVGEFVMIEDVVDTETQKAILSKDIEKVTFEIERSKKMLNNPSFVAKAPETLVKSEKEKLAKNEELLSSLQAKLSEIK